MKYVHVCSNISMGNVECINVSPQILSKLLSNNPFSILAIEFVLRAVTEYIQWRLIFETVEQLITHADKTIECHSTVDKSSLMHREKVLVWWGFSFSHCSNSYINLFVTLFTSTFGNELVVRMTCIMYISSPTYIL